jgi:hypothetical protein
VDVNLLDELDARTASVVGARQHRRRRAATTASRGGVAELGGIRESGPRAGTVTGRQHRCRTRCRDLDVLIFGHSHIPRDTTDAGLRCSTRDYRTTGAESSSRRTRRPGSTTGRLDDGQARRRAGSTTSSFVGCAHVARGSDE